MAFEHGHALIIGVGEYVHHSGSNFPMASEDARRVASVLADEKLCGYLPEQVTLLTYQPACRDADLQALSSLSNVGEDDKVLQKNNLCRRQFSFFKSIEIQSPALKY